MLQVVSPGDNGTNKFRNRNTQDNTVTRGLISCQQGCISLKFCIK